MKYTVFYIPCVDELTAERDDVPEERRRSGVGRSAAVGWGSDINSVKERKADPGGKRGRDGTGKSYVKRRWSRVCSLKKQDQCSARYLVIALSGH